MTPELRAQYKADVARCRAERDAYKSRASFNRTEYHRLNKAKRWLDALQALDRYHEYRRTAAYYDAEVKRLREFLR
jgi:hypothetical protein